MKKAIALKPRLSEKTYEQSSQSVYVFEVDKDLNKHEIAQAVAQTFEVDVTAVRTTIQKGKVKRSYRNRQWSSGKRSDFKKAYVTLKSGQTIPVFAGTEQADEPEQKPKKKAKKESKES